MDWSCFRMFNKVEEKKTSPLKVILIGFDTELDFDKMTKTCIMLNKDLPYIATNPDLVCPVSFGYVPDCGSMAISYRNATGKYPIFIGKP